MAYSIDYIKRAVGYKQEGHTFKELKEVFKIPPETYYAWEKRLDSGYYDVKHFRQRRRKIDKQKLKEAVDKNPDAFLKEFALHFDCTAQAVFYALRKLKITLKKKPLPIRKNRKKSVKSFSQS